MLLTFDWFFTAFSIITVFKSKILILFIFKYLFKNNIRNLKWSSKTKTKSKNMSFESIVFCKMSVLHNYIKPHFCILQKAKQKTNNKKLIFLCNTLIKVYLFWNCKQIQFTNTSVCTEAVSDKTLQSSRRALQNQQLCICGLNPNKNNIRAGNIISPSGTSKGLPPQVQSR